MKLAFIIQRYGTEIIGGAEYHCRVIAERLARTHTVDIVTTTAKDYIYWKKGYPAGTQDIHGVTVRRFPLDAQRSLPKFRDISDLVFYDVHTTKDEEKWIYENGPRSKALVKWLMHHHADYDCLLAYSYRYWTAYQAVTHFPEKIILVPTAEEDPAINLKLYRKFFALPAGYLFMTQEEKELIVTRNVAPLPPSEIIGFPFDPRSEEHTSELQSH